MKKLILLCVFTLFATTNVQAANEGIKVHGHWQFDIYNKDGSFDRKVEFENALLTFGAETLAKLLNNEVSVFKWAIRLKTNSGFICNQHGSGTSDCVIDEFNNLVKNTNGSNFILSGSTVVEYNSQINLVRTSVATCTGEVSSLACTGVEVTSMFSEKDLGINSVDVLAGQTINVTVTFSFS